MRSYGVGSVRQVTTGRYAGWWVAEWDLPRTEDGRRRRRRVVRKTENEAKRAMKAEAGKFSSSRPRSAERVDEFLLRWLDDVVRRTRRERTLVGYRQIVTTHLIPGLGSHEVGALTRRDVQRWVSGLDLHPTTVRHIVACLGAAYSYAVKWDLCDTNPARELDLPAKRSRVVRAVTPEEAREIVEKLRDTPVGDIVTVAIYTGLRQGELLGLRWQDVNLKARTVTVNGSLSRLPGRTDKEGIRYVLTAPKTKGSIRTVTLAPEALEVLSKRRKTALASKTDLHGLVFPRPDGQPQDAPKLTYQFQQALESAGLPVMRFHDLRHATASLLIGSGVPIAVVSRILGHAGIAITVDTYGHLTRDVQDEAIARLAAAIG